MIPITLLCFLLPVLSNYIEIPYELIPIDHWYLEARYHNRINGDQVIRAPRFFFYYILIMRLHSTHKGFQSNLTVQITESICFYYSPIMRLNSIHKGFQCNLAMQTTEIVINGSTQAIRAPPLLSWVETPYGLIPLMRWVETVFLAGINLMPYL